MERINDLKLPACKKRDIIEMIIDLKAQKLHYTINGRVYDELSQIIEFAQYRAGVWMCCVGNAYKLLE